MSKGHTHHRTSGEAYEQYAFVLKMKTLVTENLHEIHASALAPVLIVIAFKYVPRLGELVEFSFGNAQ